MQDASLQVELGPDGVVGREAVTGGERERRGAGGGGFEVEEIGLACPHGEEGDVVRVGFVDRDLYLEEGG